MQVVTWLPGLDGLVFTCMCSLLRKVLLARSLNVGDVGECANGGLLNCTLIKGWVLGISTFCWRCYSATLTTTLWCFLLYVTHITDSIVLTQQYPAVLTFKCSHIESHPQHLTCGSGPWQGYLSLLAIYNEIITVRGLVSALHGRVFQAQV